jgi:hypothetical protein
MYHVLQKYTLNTCCESAQSGPPIMCFHLEHQIDPIRFKSTFHLIYDTKVFEFFVFNLL